jgi:hypothetical protein
METKSEWERRRVVALLARELCILQLGPSRRLGIRERPLVGIVLQNCQFGDWKLELQSVQIETPLPKKIHRSVTFSDALNLPTIAPFVV